MVFRARVRADRLAAIRDTVKRRLQQSKAVFYNGESS